MWALKIMDKNEEHQDAMLKIVAAEIETMAELNHPNIVNLLDYSLQDSLVKPNGETKDVFYLALELASGGELFDFIAETGAFTEPVARYFFQQLIEALSYMAANGVCHRDIKPENIMFDSDYNLKLADFGFSSHQARNQSRKGTLGYMAPEVIEGALYNGHCADLFSAAIIAFLMISCHPPFKTACASDAHYRLIMGNRPDLFWKLHEASKPKGFYSADFKDLITMMLSCDPLQRPSLAEIRAHEWFKGPVPLFEEIKEEFDVRNDLLNQDTMQSDRQSPSEPADPWTLGNGPKRSEDEKEIERIILPYIPKFKRFTQFFATADLDNIFNALGLYAERHCDSFKFDIKSEITQTYTYSALMTTKGDEPISFTANILNVESTPGQYWVEIIKESGDKFEFDQVYKNVKEFVKLNI